MSWRDRILERDTNACTHAGAGTFCPECGRSMVPPPRYSFTEMLGPPTDIWLKKGFRRTLFGLFIHPGRSIRTFLFQDRDHLVKPAAYLIVAVAVNLWVASLFEEVEVCTPDDGFCLLWRDAASTLQLFQVGVFALIYRVMFRKAGLNLWEYGVGFCYIVAQAFLLDAILTLVFGVIGSAWRDVIGFTAYSIYLVVATVQLLQIRGAVRVTGAVLIGTLAMVLYVLLVVALSFAWVETSVDPAAPAGATEPAIAAPPA